MIEQVIFFALAAVAIIGAIAVVLSRNLFHAVMILGGFLLTIAGFYFLLNADFVGIMQVFVYVGGVIVVMLFGIMLTPHEANITNAAKLQQKLGTYIAVAALIGLLAMIFIRTTFITSPAEPVKDTVSLAGKLFMTNYVLPFEVISVLLLAALVGAIIVARKEEH